MTNAVAAVRQRFAAKRTEESTARERIEEAAAKAATGGKVDDAKIVADLELAGLTDADFARKAARYTERAELAKRLGDKTEARLRTTEARNTLLAASRKARYAIADILEEFIKAATEYQAVAQAIQSDEQAEKQLLATLPDPIRRAYEHAIEQESNANSARRSAEFRVLANHDEINVFVGILHQSKQALCSHDPTMATGVTHELARWIGTLNTTRDTEVPTVPTNATSKQLVRLRKLAREVRPSVAELPKIARNTQAKASN